MTVSKMKKITISLLLFCVLAMTTVFSVFAATKTTTKTTYVGGGSGWINWSFTSSGSNSKITSYGWGNVSTSTGISVTKWTQQPGPTTSEGWMTASYMGSVEISNKRMVLHKISGDTISEG